MQKKSPKLMHRLWLAFHSVQTTLCHCTFTMSHTPFTQRVIEVIRAVPHGMVATYGGVARLAGSPRAARQVVRVLHTCSRSQGLPWHRIINREGRISLAEMQGGDTQRSLLEKEGVRFDNDDRVDLDRFEWRPEPGELVMTDQ